MRSVSRSSGHRAEKRATALLHVCGEIDLASVPVLTARLMHSPADERRDVVLDLSGVTFLDCAALGVLVAARTRLGDRLWLRAPAPCVVQLLRLTGVWHVFAVLPDASSLPEESDSDTPGSPGLSGPDPHADAGLPPERAASAASGG